MSRERNRLKYLGLTIAAVIFSLIFFTNVLGELIGSNNFTNIADIVQEWGHVLCLSFVLSSLAIFIRDSKPAFAQFPLSYTALPLLIVVSYILVQDTYAIKTWLLSIYQAGAILVATLMYSVYTYRNSEYWLILVGSSLFVICYLLFWYVPVIDESHPWIWQIVLAASIIVTVLGYEKVGEQMTQTVAETNFFS